MEPVGAREQTLRQLRRGVLPHAVLAALARQERYGFELVRLLTEEHGFAISEGTIYPLLSRLRRDGLVQTSWRESDAGPPRRYYRLTRDGRLALDGFRTEWRSFRDAVDALIAPDAPRRTEP
ncbi:MAG: PadR family transcriptional regulator [Nitriliruptoraceae bacterium]